MITPKIILKYLVIVFAIVAGVHAPVKAQTKYCYVILQQGGGGMSSCAFYTYSNVFELKGSNANLSEKELVKKFFDYTATKTNDCLIEVVGGGGYAFVNRFNSYEEAQSSRDSQIEKDKSDTYYTFWNFQTRIFDGFSISGGNVQDKAKKAGKKYICPYIQFSLTKSGCNKVAVFGNIVEYNCLVLTAANNFGDFFQKNYEDKIILCHLDGGTPVSYVYSDAYEDNYDRVVRERDRQISFLKNSGWTIKYINDFQNPCISVGKTAMKTPASPEQKLAKEKAAATKFLAENRRKSGVISTPSGLQYQTLRKGTGSKPTELDTVVCHYRAYLTNGREIASSYLQGGPQAFTFDKVIPGFKEGMSFMSKGSRVKLYIPGNLAFGDQGSGDNIPGGAVIIFDVEVLDVKPGIKSNAVIQFKNEDILGTWTYTQSWPSDPGLGVVMGKMTFEVDEDDPLLLKITTTLDPGQRFSKGYVFKGGLVADNGIFYRIKTDIPEIDQQYSLSIISNTLIKGTVKNIRTKPIPDRPESWDIPAEIELTRTGAAGSGKSVN